MIETQPLEKPCASCPKRNPLSRALAHIGIFESGIKCPGSSIVDTINVAKAASATENSRVLIVSPSLASREEQCGLDDIKLPEGTAVTETERNEQGRLWVRALTGDRATAITMAAFANMYPEDSRRVEVIGE
jgi:hypothetical protein